MEDRLLYVTVLSVILFSTGCLSQACGKASLNPHIVGGDEASPSAWPWQVYLEISDSWGWRYSCGGSLISDRWVLTAGHCHHGMVMSDTNVWLGVHALSDRHNNRTAHKVIQVEIHPMYNSEGVYDHDIALLKLNETVTFSDEIQPVCLAEKNSTFNAGLSMWATGWGRTSEGGYAPDDLQEVCLPIVADDECQSFFTVYDFTIPSKTICAGHDVGGKGACSGDSGGPLVVKKDSVWVQAGVVSSGFGCARPNAPGFYAEVSLFQDWIENKTASDSPPGFTNFTSPDDDDRYNCGLTPQTVACGTAPLNPHIVGGDAADTGAWPWQAHIETVSLDGYRYTSCGGSLISDRWVMTAAHCHKDRNMNLTKVYLGVHAMWGPYENLALYKVIHVELHPSYNSEGNYNNDIALLKLHRRVTYTNYTRPICLADMNSTLNDGLSMWISGWGRTSEGGWPSNQLQEVCLPLVPDDECQTYFTVYNFTIPSKTICAGHDAGAKGICQGDSGGALVVKKDSVWVQTGIVSSAFGCARPDAPAFFAEVSLFQDWIKNKTASDSPPGFTTFTSPDDDDRYNCGETAQTVACGTTLLNPHIVGGDYATKGAWPWQAYIWNENSNGDSFSCGGSLISDQWVMTAAHCFDDALMSETMIYLGMHAQWGPFGNVAVYKVIHVERHESYNSEGNANNDIALLKLHRRVTFTNFIRPICLAEKNSTLKDGLSMWVTGWGKTSEDGYEANTLQEVCLPLVRDEKCQALFTNYTIPNKTICAGYDRGGKGACEGDSGGALVVKKDSIWVQVGIVSSGFGCARRNSPGFYTEVPLFQDWIENKTASASSPGFTTFTSTENSTSYNCDSHAFVCGVAPLNPHIVGGDAATVAAWPWQAYIRTYHINGSSATCGGSLINEQWVLTAAHCLDDMVMYLTDVYLGFHSWFGPFDNFWWYWVIQTVIHPSYNSDTLNNNIALLKLDMQVTFTNFIRPICLAEKSSTLKDGLSMWVTGWGEKSEDGYNAYTLQEVCLPLVRDEKCQALFTNYTIPNKTICAGYDRGGKGACEGDYGGALVVKEDLIWVQVGIVSSGFGCARPNSPGFYTEVPLFQDWIESSLGYDPPPGFTTVTSSENSTSFNCDSNAFVCGVAPLNPHIVGGDNATVAAWPWQAYIRTYHINGSSATCGGSLINEQWVLTAAHCLDDVLMDWTDVFLGVHAWSGSWNNVWWYWVIKAVIHPSYNSEGTLNNDIALLKLDMRVTFTNFIRPICLADMHSTLNDGLSMWVSGWGATSEGGEEADILQEVCLPLVPDDECQTYFTNYTIPSKSICAGYNAGGKDTCQGDSGGALVAKKGSIWVQVGIVSSGFGCAQPSSPGFYTEVPFFQDWIESSIGYDPPPGFITFTSPDGGDSYNCGFTDANSTTAPPTANATMHPTANATMHPTMTTTTMHPTTTTTMHPTTTTTMHPTMTTTTMHPTMTTTTMSPIATTTTAPLTGASSTVATAFSMRKTFTEELNDPNSQGYQNLANTIESGFGKILTPKFPNFLRASVQRFRPGSVKADVNLQFKGASTTINATNIVATLTDAVNNNDSDIANLDIDATTIAATVLETTTAAPTTAAPTTTTAAPTTTTTTTTLSTDPPSGSESPIEIRFSLSDDYTSELSDSSTSQYQTLAKTVVGELNSICLQTFPRSFSRSIVNSFANGSIVVNGTLVFKNETVAPSPSKIQQELGNQLPNSTVLNVIAGSIFVESSGWSLHRTVVAMPILTLILLVITQILSDM